MTLARRDFIKLGSAALTAVSWPAGLARAQAPSLGRVVVWSASLYATPDYAAKRVGLLRRDDVITILGQAEGPGIYANNRTWFELEGGYVYSSFVQPVQWMTNAPTLDIGGGRWAEVSVPFTPGYGRKLYYSAVFRVIGAQPDAGGAIWYQLGNLRAQAVTAFENSNRITRRAFLKIGSAGLLAAAVRPRGVQAGDRAIFLGRIINRQYIFDRPTEEANRLVKLKTDDVINVYEKLTFPGQLPYDRNWFRTDGGYVNAATVQPVQRKYNQPFHEMPPTGLLGEITLPFADARRQPEDNAPVVYRLYYATTYWIKERVTGDSGGAWYKLWDELLQDYYYVPAEAVRPILASELRPLAPDVPDKRIEVNLARQTVEAFEGERSVFKVPTSTGRMFPRADGGRDDFRTPTGDFAIQRKRPTRHMAAADVVASDGYDLPGVPWVSYLLWWGISFHGTYWHNDFGRVHSHGCINLRPQDAKWLFRWSLPVAPYGEEYVAGAGTQVVSFVEE